MLASVRKVLTNDRKVLESVRKVLASVRKVLASVRKALTSRSMTKLQDQTKLPIQMHFLIEEYSSLVDG